MKFFIATLALVGAAAAHTFSTVPVTVPAATPTTTPASSSTVSATATPFCDIESDGDNGNHYGWCKKANHWGTYKNGKSGDADDLGPSEE